MFTLCQKKCIPLLRYNYNEPCCGKDQCDRESAAAKTIIRSYVDSGKDLLTAEDIHQSLHYGYGMRNAQVAVAEISTKDVVLECHNIPNINNFHSFKFSEDHMKMWRYYGVGEGKIQEYSGIKMKPALTILPYISTDSSIQRCVSNKKKKGKRRSATLFTVFLPRSHML